MNPEENLRLPGGGPEGGKHRHVTVAALIRFLETDVIYAAYSTLGLTDLSLRASSGDPEWGQARHAIHLRSILDDDQADPRDRQLVRELIRFLETGRHQMPLDYSRFTPFQQRVFAATAQIAPGRILTYKDIATIIGQPTAYRAVGNALALTPVAVLMPAHRVLSRAGLDVCKSGAGLYRARLLAWEGHDLNQLMGKTVCSRKLCCSE